jgi:hypothetical protein
MLKKKAHGILGLFCIFMILSVSPVIHGETAKVALIAVANYSGVDEFRNKKIAPAITDVFVKAVQKEKRIDFLDDDAAKREIQKKNLEAFYEAGNLCTKEDLCRIGRKIGVTHLATLEINGFNEIRKEKSSKRNYQVLLGLKVIDCSNGAELYFQGEGFNEGDMNKAFANAVTRLVNAYFNIQAEDPNTGNERAENTSVIGNKTSHIYHLTQNHHLPGPEQQVVFSSRSEAEKNGYRPCPVCFPPYKAILNGDRALEESLGQEGCGTLEYYYRVEENPEVIARLKKVAAPLIADSTRKNYEYKFRLLDTDEINAFAAPNGFIYVTKGLLNIVESDDELAFVLAHELGHLEKKHAVISYKKAQAASFLASLLIIAAASNKNNNDQTAVALATLVMTNIILKGYSRDQEKEADEMALTHLKRTGMDFRAYRMVMGKFIDLRQKKVSTIAKVFSTHPVPEDRIANLENYYKAYESLQEQLAK